MPFFTSGKIVLLIAGFYYIYHLGIVFMSSMKVVREILDLPSVVQTLWNRREVILSLTSRDFRARFRGSFGGLLWSFVQPLVMMLIYTLVFSAFLKVRFGNSDSPFIFSVYLLCGLLPWNAFAEGTNASTAVIRQNTNLVKRVVFPLEVLPLSLVLVNLIQQVIGLVLLIPLSLVATGQLYSTLLFIPVILLVQFLLYAGFTWFWSSLAVYLPDLRQLTSLFLSVLIFLTPIFYPEEIIPAWARTVLQLNPLAHLVSMYRKVLMSGTLPSVIDFLAFFFFSILVFLLGFAWFNRTKKGFADVL